MSLLHPSANLPPPPTRKTVLDVFGTRWGACSLAAVAAAGLIYYLAWVAPVLVPVPATVKVPYPQATRFLEGVSTWCGAHRLLVVATGLVLLTLAHVAGGNGPRAHLWLAMLLSTTLVFSYLSISAPIDRLVQQVRSSLNGDRPLPDYLPGHVREKQ
jgi:type II secretory pathway component PulF